MERAVTKSLTLSIHRRSWTEVSKFINKNEDLMNKLFGDNFKVVITREEIRVEEYDCGY
jgi:hypothetical protein